MERSVLHIRRVDPGQCKDKSYYNYYGFKTYNDKIFIIVILKLNPGIDPGQYLDHELG